MTQQVLLTALASLKHGGYGTASISRESGRWKPFPLASLTQKTRGKTYNFECDSITHPIDYELYRQETWSDDGDMDGPNNHTKNKMTHLIQLDTIECESQLYSIHSIFLFFLPKKNHISKTFQNIRIYYSSEDSNFETNF